MGTKLVVSLLACLGTGSTASAAAWLPADGIWQIDGANGSGLTLDVRDSVVGIGLYTYDENGDSVWYVGAAPRESGRIAARMTRYVDNGNGTPPTPDDTLELVLDFDASATGWLRIDGGEPRHARHAPFGQPYVTGLDEQPTDVPIPDLRGRWVFANSDEDHGEGAIDLTFTQMLRQDARVTFSTADSAPNGATLGCAAGPDGAEPRFACTLFFTRFPFFKDVALVTPPPPPDAVLAPGDLASTRISDSAADWIGFRVPATANAPQSGIWQIVGRFGEGVTIDVRPELVAIGVYGGDDGGRSPWSLATGPLVDGVLEAELVTFADGACLGCEASDPQIAATRPMRLEFVGATRARLQIGDAEPLALALLPFGAQYDAAPFPGDADGAAFGGHPLPLLPGSDWVRTAIGPIDVPLDFDRAAAFGIEEVDNIVGTNMRTLLATSLPHWGPPSPLGGTERTQLACFGAGPTQAHCDLRHWNSGGSPPGTPQDVADIEPWNITATRMSGTLDGTDGEPLYVFRIPPRPATGTR